MGCFSSKFSNLLPVGRDCPKHATPRPAQSHATATTTRQSRAHAAEILPSTGTSSVEAAAGQSAGGSETTAQHPANASAAAEAASAVAVPTPQLKNLLKELQAAVEKDSVCASDQLLQLVDAALTQLQQKQQQQASTSGPSQAANNVLEKPEPHVNALTGLAIAFRGAVSDVTDGAFVSQEVWNTLGSTATALLNAGAAATYIGPVFALLGYAIQQWSTCEQVPQEALDLLTATRDMLFDLNRACRHIIEQQQHSVLDHRLQRWLRLAAQAAAECVVVHEQRLVFRFCLAHTYTASLAKQTEGLKSIRSELNTLLAQVLADRFSVNEANALLYKNEILMRLAPTFRHIPRLTGKEGRDDLVNQLRLQLLSNGGVMGMLLHGMGGIGKTTLAALLTDHMQQITPPPFPGGVFWVSVQAEVHYTADSGTLIRVQRKLLSKLTGRVEQAPESLDIGAHWLANELTQLRSKGPVLLVVDNVPEDGKGITGMLPNNLDDVLPAGSRMLFTSRSATPVGIPACSISCSIDGLSREASIRVLLAGGVRLENDQLEQALAFCGGLPLALELLNGALKAARTQPSRVMEWLAIHGNIGRDRQDPLWSRLRFSVEQLDNEWRGTWLDLAWVLTQFTMLELEDMLQCVDASSHDVQALHDRNLITLQNKKIYIHDVLLELAKHMIGQDSGEYRATVTWNGLESYPGTLPLPSYTGVCRGLWVKDPLFMPKSIRAPIDIAVLPPVQHLRHLALPVVVGVRDLGHILNEGTNLRYLAVTTPTPIADGNAYQLCELRMLKLRGNLGSPSFTSLQLPLLKVLLLKSQSTTHLDDSIGGLQQLRVLNLVCCYSLQQLPEGIGNLQSLQQFLLTGCEQLGNLPDSIGQLTALRVMRLEGCQKLRKLPDTIGQLTKLRELWLTGCKQLSTLPESIGQLKSLEELQLTGCKELSTLPESIGLLTAMLKLLLTGCERLSTLPVTIGQLAALQWLRLDGCTQLKTLLKSIGQLAALRWLRLNGCTQLNTLPESFGQLAALQWLQLDGCTQLNSLPASCSDLTGLQNLLLSGCKQLNELPECIGQLSRLQYLELADCEELNTLPQSFGQLTLIRKLRLEGSRQLSALPASVGQLLALTELSLCSCKQLTTLPESIGQLTALKGLQLSHCQQLSILPQSIGQLAALTGMQLNNCLQLSSLPESIQQLTALQVLNLHGCQQLSSLPESIGQLTALQVLNLHGCQQLSSLPESIGQLTALQVLNLHGCQQLSSLPESIGQLMSLLKLRLFGCQQLSTLPDSIGLLTALTELWLGGCKLLHTLPEAIGQLSSLEELRLKGCKQLRTLPESIGELKKLQWCLVLDGCEQLSGLPESIGQLTALQALELRGCKQLSTLPDSIQHLRSLRWLRIHQCQLLSTLPESISRLRLWGLWLEGCEQLIALPESIGQLAELQELSLKNCKQLSGLPESMGQLAALTKLSLVRCEKLRALPGSIGQLPALQLLWCKGCRKLVVLPESIGQSTRLRYPLHLPPARHLARIH